MNRFQQLLSPMGVIDVRRAKLNMPMTDSALAAARQTHRINDMKMHGVSSLRAWAGLTIGSLIIVVGCASGGAASGGAGGEDGSGTGSGTGTGTGSDSGSSVGTGSGSTGSGSIVIAPENMIDDLEDGDDEIIATAERSGSWYTYNDGTSGGSQTPSSDGAFVPTEGGVADSKFSARTNGSGFSDWGAGVGLDLNGAAEAGELKGTVDASAFTGVAFWAKGNVTIGVKLVMDEVLSSTLGGLCEAPAGGGSSPGGTGGADGAGGATGAGGGGMGAEVGTACDDTHGKSVTLSETWTQYAVAFSDVVQGGWGKAVSFDPSRLVGIQIATAPGAEFDVSIDDIGFY